MNHDAGDGHADGCRAGEASVVVPARHPSADCTGSRGRTSISLPDGLAGIRLLPDNSIARPVTDGVVYHDRVRSVAGSHRVPNTLVRRSTLMMPVNVRKFVERAHLRGADVVLLDLEDSVAPSAKRDARSFIAEAAASAGRGGADVFVRVNNTPDLLEGDLEAAVVAGRPWLDAAQGRLRGSGAKRGPAPVGAGGEPRPARRLHRANRPDRVGAGNPERGVDRRGQPADRRRRPGSGDYCLDIDVEPTSDGEEIAYANQAIVVAARVAGIQPLGLATTLSDYTDLAALAESARRGRRIGFKGALCIHPAQVPILNEAFSPKPEEVELARRVVELLDDAGRAGAGFRITEREDDRHAGRHASAPARGAGRSDRRA